MPTKRQNEQNRASQPPLVFFKDLLYNVLWRGETLSNLTNNSELLSFVSSDNATVLDPALRNTESCQLVSRKDQIDFNLWMIVLN